MESGQLLGQPCVTPTLAPLSRQRELQLPLENDWVSCFTRISLFRGLLSGLKFFNVKKKKGGSVAKNPSVNAGDEGSNPWVEKIPRRKKWQYTPVFLPGSHGQKNLAGHSPWNHRESDMTE